MRPDLSSNGRSLDDEEHTGVPVQGSLAFDPPTPDGPPPQADTASVSPSSTSAAPLIRFGTSSWAYEGWQGQVYQRRYAASRFSRDCLAEYADYRVGGRPLFSTVGIDHSFYRPATRAQLQHYADLVPEDFHFCLKVWEELTIPTFAGVARYGAKQGTANPRFLDAGLFAELVAGPAVAGLGDKLGVFLFEFQRTGIAPTAFLDRLEAFLPQLPPNLAYAVEVRESAILGPRYRDILAKTGVSHVYNHWTAMPSLADQHTQLGGQFAGRTPVFRLLTPRGLRYGDAVERYRPYNRLVAPLPSMRAETVALAQDAVAQGRRPYVLVNNRAEGNAPLTVAGLVELLTRQAQAAEQQTGRF